MRATKIEQRFFRSSFFTALITCMLAMCGSVSAQSTDADNPVQMVTDTVRGKMPRGQQATHYYSFVGGPGEIKVFYDFTGDGNVGGRLLDADGRPIENLDLQEGNYSHHSVIGISDKAGIRLVSRHVVKKRQKLLVAVYTDFVPTEDSVVSYKIRVAGDGVSFTQGGAAGNGASSGGQTNSSQTEILPKSGILRLEMNDGTVQEIKLSSVRKASIRP